MSDGERRGWFERLFPRMIDFRTLLLEQSAQTEQAIRELASMLVDDGVDAERLEELERDADALRERNARRLNEAFSTAYDREDIQRAIEELDWIVSHTMSTAREMAVLEVPTDDVITDMLEIVAEGAGAIRQGFEHLKGSPERAAEAIGVARRTDRRARRRYERGLAELFAVGDPLRILRRREIYHHLKDAAKRVYKTAVVLDAIRVKDV